MGLLHPGTPDAQGGIHWLGTDGQGRDLLGAILGGLRISFGIGLVTTLVTLVVGAAIGLTGASIGGRLDLLVMRTVELQLGFPAILICIVLLALTGRGVGNLVLVLVIAQWATYARIVHNAALGEQGKTYLEAARGLALRPTRILLRHLLPNCVPPLVVTALLQLTSAIALEATLSYLGLGLPLSEPSLGLLIANGYPSLIAGHYWISVFPGIALAGVLLGTNVFTERLRELLRLRARQ